MAAAVESTELADDYVPDSGDVTGSQPMRQAQAFWPTAVRMLGLLGREPWQLALATVLVIGSVVLTVIAPRVLGQAVDVIAQGVPSGGIDFAELARLILVVLALYLFASLLIWWQGYVMNALVMRVVYMLREDIERQLHRLPLSYFDARSRGDLISRVTNDIDNVQQVLQQGFAQIMQSVLTILGIGVMMFWLSWQLALIALIALPLSGVIVALVGVRAQKLFTAQWQSMGAVNAHIEDALTGHEVVRVFHRDTEMLREFDERNNRLYDAAFKAQAFSGSMSPATQFIEYLSYVLIAVVGALRVTAGQLTLGEVVAFIQYAREFAQPAGQLAGAASALQSGVASAERSFELLDAEPESADTAPELLGDASGARAADARAVHRAKGHLEFAEVSFSYDAESPLIEGLSLTVLPGQSLAIVGPTGAGKTTLVNLIMRFYELTAGRILLDGVDITSVSRAELREQVGMVLQDAWLFEGTIRENIRYGRLDATDQEVVAAAQATMVDRFVRGLPAGYDTVLEENASSLSQGERQLITIARAFLANPALLILDEATSSVDTRTEVLVQDAMRALRADRTSVVIAHRLSTIRDADIILMMQHGRIVEQGTHEELLALRGSYFGLYQAQASGAASA